jgi:hypothetical protein
MSYIEKEKLIKADIASIENTVRHAFNQGYDLGYKEGKSKQEPKTGHWIKYGVPRCGEQHYKCTSCGYYINFGQWGELYTKEFKYCPNCKAKMVEPQESEDKE